MDSIHLSKIRSYGYTGFLPEEQTLGQWFEVDLTLWLDLHPAGNSDQIQDTLDYRAAIAIVQDTLATAKFSLVEALAETIAQRILALPGPIKAHQVRVQLTKPAPPIPNFSGGITIDILRTALDQGLERGCANS
jgi:7,8-dihydroneopterin aldolase/epimerase/oxygenase